MIASGSETPDTYSARTSTQPGLHGLTLVQDFTGVTLSVSTVKKSKLVVDGTARGLARGADGALSSNKFLRPTNRALIGHVDAYRTRGLRTCAIMPCVGK